MKFRTPLTAVATVLALATPPVLAQGADDDAAAADTTGAGTASQATAQTEAGSVGQGGDEASDGTTAAEDVTADTVVAVVNGKPITLGHMLMVRAGLPDEYQKLPNDVLFKGILDQLIQQQALAEEPKGPLPKRVQLALDNELRTLLAAEKLNAVADAAVTEEAINEVYQRDYVQAPAQKEWKASHILVDSEDEAKAIIDELRGGADFAELAKARSTGPSGAKGGALGWFGKGAMVPQFESAVAALKPGQISDPVKTQFGWHVIRLEDVREKEKPALDQVRDEIVSKIRQQAAREYLEKAMTEAQIDLVHAGKIDPNVLSRFELLDNKPQ